MADLQAQVDAFDRIYNTERPHQGLPGRVTPQTAWDATDKVEAPRPTPRPPQFAPLPDRRPGTAPTPTDLPAGTHARRLSSIGTFCLDRVHYKVGGVHRFKQVLVVAEDDTITVADLHGEILIEYTRPAPGVTYVGNGRRPGPNNSESSPKS